MRCRHLNALHALEMIQSRTMTRSHNLFLTLSAGFADHLDRCCLRVPDGDDWSYGALDSLSGKLATVLLQRANAGDRVLVQTNKSPQAVALYLACLRAGLVLVPLNTAYTDSELQYFRENARPRLQIDDSGLRKLCLEAEGCEIANTVAVGEDDIAAILYTSGTTGKPKGAMLSHGNLRSNALTLHALWGFIPGDVLLHALPIFHVHGLFVALNTALINGSTILFLERFDAATVIGSLPGATVMMGVPTFYSRLLDEPGFSAAVCQSIRLFISGSAPLSRRVFDAFEQRSGHRILERYGMSETGMISSNPLDGERVAGTVGFALPGVDLRIADETGEPVQEDIVGQVEVRGANVFQGYWEMPEKTASEFRKDGYFTTGDLGSIDTEGRLTLSGRSKDLIISGGLNVYPKEIEQCLETVPGISESAVIGLPHADFGEAVVAVYACNSDGFDIATAEAGLKQRLAAFKQPKAYIQLDALPRNTMGKIQKAALRERFQNWFSDSYEEKDKTSG